MTSDFAATGPSEPGRVRRSKIACLPPRPAST